MLPLIIALTASILLFGLFATVFAVRARRLTQRGISEQRLCGCEETCETHLYQIQEPTTPAAGADD